MPVSSPTICTRAGSRGTIRACAGTSACGASGRAISRCARRAARHFFLQGQGYWALANWTLRDLTGNPRFARLRARGHRGDRRGAARGRLVGVSAARAPAPGGDGGGRLRRDGAARGLPARDRGPPAALGARTGTTSSSSGSATRSTRAGSPSTTSTGRAAWCPTTPPSGSGCWGASRSVTGDERFLGRVSPLLGFLEAVQLPSGELPYELGGKYEASTRIHYLCYQYNAFQCMKLAWHAEAHARARAQAPGNADRPLPGRRRHRERCGARRVRLAAARGGVLRRRGGHGAPYRDPPRLGEPRSARRPRVRVGAVAPARGRRLPVLAR